MLAKTLLQSVSWSQAKSVALPLCFCCGHVCLQTFVCIVQAVLDDGRKRELQNVIQSHFKEWVVNSGNMRQVYDLARMERGDGVSTPHAI